LGQPDHFHLRYIDESVLLIGDAMREGTRLRNAIKCSKRYANENATRPDRERHCELVD